MTDRELLELIAKDIVEIKKDISQLKENVSIVREKIEDTNWYFDNEIDKLKAAQ